MGAGVQRLQIVTNPGSNLSPGIVARYGIHLTPQRIVVDGEYHDTRGPIPLKTVDTWVANARRHPQTVGTTAAEFTSFFQEIARDGEAILAVLTSRRIIGSFDAAVASVEVMKPTLDKRGIHISLFDSTYTEMATGLLTVLAAEAAKAGQSLPAILELLEVARQRIALFATIQTLDNLVKGGRASVMKAWLADFLHVRPVIGMVDGIVQGVDRMKSHADPTLVLIDQLKKKVPPGQRVWAGIAHSDATEAAAAVLADRLRSTYKVEFLMSAPVTPAIYLHLGPGSLYTTVMPVGTLPWQPRLMPAPG